MGAVLSHFLFKPPTPSYSLQTTGSPPLVYVDGVPCFWFPARAENGVIVYAHCNGLDLGAIRHMLFEMSRTTGWSVLAVEYPGYGVHGGAPSVHGCVRAVTLALDHVHRTLPGRRVALVGRSIGTGVAAQAALRQRRKGRRLAGLALISPFCSVEAMARERAGELGAAVAAGTLDTRAALVALVCSTLLLHGDQDTLIPPTHTARLARATGGRARVVWLPGSTHNDLDWRTIHAEVARFLA